MTVFYSQIQLLPELQILTGSFSAHGGLVETNSQILKDLRNVIEKIPNKSDNFFSFSCPDNRYLFYIKIDSKLLYSIVTDTTTSQQSALKYFANIQAIFQKEYTPGKKNYSSFNEKLRNSTNSFNKDSSFLEAGVELEKTQGMLANSLNHIIKRGEDLQALNVLAEQLRSASSELKKSSHRMLDSTISNYAIYAGVFFTLFLLVYFILMR
eukprot:jgi/Antlo1/1362/521